MPDHHDPHAHGHARSGPEPAIGHGVQLYSRVLQHAGGQQLQALMRSGPERSLGTALYAAPPYDLEVPPMDVARLSVNLTPARVIGGIDGDRAARFEAQRHSLFLAPAGARMHWRKEASSRHLTLYFDARPFADGDDMAAALARRDALHNLRVPGLRPLVDDLVDELRHGALHQPEAADCLARLLLIRLARHLGKPIAAPRALDPHTLARVQEHVMAHLDQRLLVADLAALAGMQIDRFAAAIKARTGQPPHRFVMALRLRQAGQLLRRTAMPIAEVAHACGFASQQHLTNAMRRHAGITPARYREAAAP